jgi:hypothetical protein
MRAGPIGYTVAQPCEHDSVRRWNVSQEERHANSLPLKLRYLKLDFGT